MTGVYLKFLKERFDKWSYEYDPKIWKKDFDNWRIIIWMEAQNFDSGVVFVLDKKCRHCILYKSFETDDRHTNGYLLFYDQTFAAENRSIS